MNFSLGEITEQEPQGGKVCLSEHRNNKLVELIKACTLMTITQEEDESDSCFGGNGVFLY